MSSITKFSAAICHRLLALVALAHPGLVWAANPPKIWIPDWRETAPLMTTRAGAAAIHIEDRLLILGGVDGKNYLNSTEQTKIGPDGELAPWQAAASMIEKRAFFAAVSNGRWIYAIAGANDENGQSLLVSVERAELDSQGNIRAFQPEQQKLNFPRRCAKAVIVGNRMFVTGGFGGALWDTVESAEIKSDGSLGPWRIEPNKLTTARYVHAVKQDGDMVYVLGGHHESQGVGLNSVEGSRLGTAEGAQWSLFPPLQTGRYGLEAAIHNDTLYALGGISRGSEYLRSIERLALTATAGNTSHWIESTMLSSPRSNFNVLVHRDWLYVIGGANALGYFKTVEFASFNEHGELGYWGTREDAAAVEARDRALRHGTEIGAASYRHNGIVLEAISAAGYSYLQVETTTGKEWLATNAGTFAKGDHVQYGNGMVMQNFHSKALNRTFPVIRFLETVQKSSTTVAP